MRATAPLAAALFAAAVLAAGCLSGPGEDEGAPPAFPPPTVLRAEGMVGASGPVFAVGGDSYEFEVPANATLLLAEIQWDDPVQDIDLALASPSAATTGNAQFYDHNAAGGSPGSPDSPHSLTVEAPEAGGWQASAFGNGASAVVPYELALTLFHGETSVPDGYTALRA